MKNIHNSDTINSTVMLILIFLLLLNYFSRGVNSNSEQCGVQLFGVSVPEVDRFNAFHNCQGCSRHRWISIRQLRSEDMGNMYSFRKVNKHGDHLYPCRVFLKDEIAIGKYNHQEQKCSIGHDSKERKYSSWFQVLTIPGGLEQTEGNILYKYELINVKSIPLKKLWNIAVPAGEFLQSPNRNSSEVEYIAFGRAKHHYCHEDVIGKIWQSDHHFPNPRAYFPLCGKEVKLHHNFNVLVCNKYVYF